MLHLDRILDTAIVLGLDRFSVAGVARSLGVTDMALYRHVGSRDELYSLAAARAHALFPGPAGRSTEPTGYLTEVAEHAWRLARRHPGIERYLLDGPYHPSTLAVWDDGIARLRAIAPEYGHEEAYLLLSRVTSVALAAADNALSRRHQEDPERPGELFGWTIRALVDGMDALLRRGDLPSNRASLRLGPESRIDPS